MSGVDPLDVSDMIMPAVVPALAAFVMVQDGDVLQLLRRKSVALAGNGQMGPARQLAVAVEALKRTHSAHLPPTGSDDGSSEVPIGRDRSGSECPPSGLSTRDAAERLRVTERQVVNLIHRPGGGLSASKRHGRWWIDRASVLAYEEAQRAKRVHESG